MFVNLVTHTQRTPGASGVWYVKSVCIVFLLFLHGRICYSFTKDWRLMMRAWSEKWSLRAGSTGTVCTSNRLRHTKLADVSTRLTPATTRALPNIYTHAVHGYQTHSDVRLMSRPDSIICPPWMHLQMAVMLTRCVCILTIDCRIIRSIQTILHIQHISMLVN